MQNTQSQKRTFTGVVVSGKQDKTITVQVTSVKMHSKYKRQYHMSKKYPVHDEFKTAKVGDTVRFVETRPISRTKRWKLAEVLTSN